MKDAAIINGEFTDLKFIKSRKVCQVVIEVPIEHGPLVVAAFGTPNPAVSVPVAIARLARSSMVEHPTFNRGVAGSSPVEPAKPKGGKLAQRAGIICNEEAFLRFMFDRYSRQYPAASSDPAWFIRDYCGVSSRADLDHNPEAAAKFKKLLDDYEIWLRHPELVE
jgi:hypothetical protein